MKMRTLFAAMLLGAALSAWGSNAAAWSLWDHYATAFVDPHGRVVDRQAGDRTTSEGQGYALFFALVANDRPRFDAVLNWTRDNLAQGDLTAHLPAWEWGRNAAGYWTVLDSHSASDADLWISYDLLEAGRLWQEPRFTALGRMLALRIASEEVANLPGLGPMLLPGATGFHPEPATWVLNPSYLPLPLLERMATLDPAGPWSGMAATLPRMLRLSAPAGFAMDWVTYSPARGFAPYAAPDSGSAPANGPAGSYDAIRVYLWAGLSNPATPGFHQVLAALPAMAAYLNTHPAPPERVSPNGTVKSPNSPPGFSAAVLPYLEASAKHAAGNAQQTRLAAQLYPATGLYGNPPAYYDQNLAMFAEGWNDRLFQFGKNGELRVKWKKA